MVVVKSTIRTNILNKFTNCLVECDVEDINILDTQVPLSRYSKLSPDSIEVEFYAEEAKVGKVIKKMVDYSNRGMFGKSTISLSPFRTV